MRKSLNIIVLIKQVPEIDEVKFDLEKGRLDRRSASAVINPFDLNALEAAVQIKEKMEGTVTALSMGPKKTERSLRDAIARGADKAVLLTDASFSGADTLATSYTLASAIKKLDAFDLIICGEKTIDGDTAQVGPEVAELLGIPHVAYVEEIRKVEEERIMVESKMGKNHYFIEIDFPGLITTTKDVNTPRLPKLRDKLKSRNAEIPKWGAKDLSEVSRPECFGLSGSPTWVAKTYAPLSEKRRGQIIKGTPEETAKTLVRILRNINVLR
jgi:electron transfer flavoprotein beta subunit